MCCRQLSYDLNVTYGWSWSGCHADNRHCTFTNGPDNMVVGKLWKPDENLERSKPIDVLMVKHVRSRQRPRWIMFTLRVNESRIYIGCKSSHGLGLLATIQGPVSISDQTPYREISQSLQGTRTGVKIFVSLWDLRLHEILQYDVSSDIETGTRSLNCIVRAITHGYLALSVMNCFDIS